MLRSSQLQYVLFTLLLLTLCFIEIGCSSNIHSQEPTERQQEPTTLQDAAVVEYPTTGPRKPALPLIHYKNWKRVPLEKDPYRAYRKTNSRCEALGMKFEDDLLELDTRYCNYITLEQHSLTEVREGEALQFVMWHQTLTSSTPGKAYVVITIDGQQIWKKDILIPGKAKAYQPFWTPKKPIPKGARIVFHLHNHGENSWRIHSLTTGQP